MSRTPLARVLQAAAAEAATEHGDRSTRRELLRRGAVAGSDDCARALHPAARGAASPRIVIVGVARLSCAYRLRQAGYVAQVYEASNRVGGRLAGPVAATSRTGSCTSTAAS